MPRLTTLHPRLSEARSQKHGCRRMDTREVTKLAADLLGSPVAIALCRGGRNSRVYRVETSAGTFALKLFRTTAATVRGETNATALLGAPASASCRDRSRFARPSEPLYIPGLRVSRFGMSPWATSILSLTSRPNCIAWTAERDKCHARRRGGML